ESDKMERSMAFFAARVHEQRSAILSAQESAAANARASQAALVDAFDDAQSRTVATVERLLEDKEKDQRVKEARERERLLREKEARSRQREARERAFADREKAARRRGRFARVALAVLLVGLGGAGFAIFQLEEQRASIA